MSEQMTPTMIATNKKIKIEGWHEVVKTNSIEVAEMLMYYMGVECLQHGFVKDDDYNVPIPVWYFKKTPEVVEAIKEGEGR
ncbi:hypothetical protein MUB16_28500 [Priestia sp. OVL9]|nr:hypothetical protein [Priestia sp. OVL9]